MQNLVKERDALHAFKSKADDEVLFNHRILIVQIKVLSEKLSKATRDLDAKSKMVLQYALRENAAKLQPSSKSTLQQDNKVRSSFHVLMAVYPDAI
jgi:hypothetical protein